jgi:hypothetical protein
MPGDSTEEPGDPSRYKDSDAAVGTERMPVRCAWREQREDIIVFYRGVFFEKC